MRVNPHGGCALAVFRAVVVNDLYKGCALAIFGPSRTPAPTRDAVIRIFYVGDGLADVPYRRKRRFLGLSIFRTSAAAPL